jgi:hypothetical protein
MFSKVAVRLSLALNAIETSTSDQQNAGLFSPVRTAMDEVYGVSDAVGDDTTSNGLSLSTESLDATAVSAQLLPPNTER